MKPDYQRAVPDVIAALGTDAARGLTETEARTRLTTFGPNKLPAERPTPAWRKFVAQFRDLLVILLLVATAISALLWWYERESPLPYEAIAIGLVVLLNAVMGYLQEQRAESAIAALQQMAAAHAVVVRGGAPMSVPAARRRRGSEAADPRASRPETAAPTRSGPATPPAETASAASSCGRPARSARARTQARSRVAAEAATAPPPPQQSRAAGHEPRPPTP